MCLWLLTACLGLLPANPSPVIVVPGVPSPILLPTTAATTAAPTTRPPPPPGTGNMTMPAPGNMTMPPMPGNMTSPPPPPPGNNTNPPPATMMTPPPATMMTPPPATMMTPPPATMMTAPPATMMTAPPATMMTPPTGTATTQPTTVRPTSASPPPTMSRPPPITTSGGVLLPLLLCNDPDVVCIFNPDENVTGPLPIDPRLGTTSGPSAALQVQGYSAQVPSFDTAVRFPREKRSVEELNAMNIKDFLNAVQTVDKKHELRKRQSCRCVPAGTCIRDGSGVSMIDIRIVTPVGSQCPAGQEYCCGSTTNTNITQIACGTLQNVPSTAITPGTGQANFGEYPWQAIILTKQNDYIAGGVLVDKLNVITVTHRLLPYIVSGTAPNVKVRLGEWDAAGTYEPVPYQEYTIQRVNSHPSYNANTLQYDITVLRLSTAVPFTPAAGAAVTINRACLPPAATTTYTGQRCWVSGWGKNMFGMQGQYQQILKKVDIPIVAPATCQTQLQTARLGPTYVLDTTSFVCAGGEANKDTCTGDGGSGLVCQVNGQWVVVGLVAWGLGCASANVSAAYVNVAGLLPWIQQQIAAA